MDVRHPVLQPHPGDGRAEQGLADAWLTDVATIATIETIATIAKRGVKVAGLACLALAFVAEPWVPALCPTRLLFHVPCPSCGLTRAARSLLHGDLVAATRFHPLWWAVFGYLGPLVALEALSYVRRGTFGEWTQRPLVQRVGLGLVVALVLVWGAREAGAFGGPVSIE